MMFGDCGSQQVDHPGRAVMTTGRHPDLDIACPVSDHLTDRKANVEFLAALGDFPDVS